MNSQEIEQLVEEDFNRDPNTKIWRKSEEDLDLYGDDYKMYMEGWAEKFKEIGKELSSALAYMKVNVLSNKIKRLLELEGIILDELKNDISYVITRKDCDELDQLLVKEVAGEINRINIYADIVDCLIQKYTDVTFEKFDRQKEKAKIFGIPWKEIKVLWNWAPIHEGIINKEWYFDAFNFLQKYNNKVEDNHIVELDLSGIKIERDIEDVIETEHLIEGLLLNQVYSETQAQVEFSIVEKEKAMIKQGQVVSTLEKYNIQNLKYLRKLSLYKTNVTDISPLVGLNNLEELDIEGVNIKDMSPLVKLPNLKVLQIGKIKHSEIPYELIQKQIQGDLKVYGSHKEFLTLSRPQLQPNSYLP